MTVLQSSAQLARSLLIQQEMEQDKRDLRKLGLTEEEVTGYIEFYLEKWFNWEVAGEN